MTGDDASPPGTRIVAIDGIDPTKPALRDGTYKLRRPLYARKSEQKPWVTGFLEFIRSAEGQRISDRF